jgi:glutamate-1-semialdehyde 2,1-aminomutase
MLTPFFGPGPVTDYETAKGSDTAAFGRWFHRMLTAGVSLPPSQFEAAFLATAHDDAALTHLEEAVNESFQALSRASGSVSRAGV